MINRRTPSDGIRPALDPIIENQPVVAVEDDDSGEDTLKAKTVKDSKPKDVEVRNFCILWVSCSFRLSLVTIHIFMGN